MSEVQEEVSQTEAEELASAMAGYNARGGQPPAEETSQQPEEVDVVAPVIDEPPPEPSVADELAVLKAKVKTMQDSGDSDAVRKLHGEIGNINRTIQQMQAPAKPAAPATDEVAEALASAEVIADEYPDIGAPIVRALKALAARSPAELPDIDGRVAAQVATITQRNAIEQLSEDHPDFSTVRETPEFKAWLSAKAPEFQERFSTTWNPAVVSRGLTEFKAAQAATEAAKIKKQGRLAAAVTPRGVPQTNGPSTIPDEDGALNGYNRKRLR
jgi:hypothetical protein